MVSSKFLLCGKKCIESGTVEEFSSENHRPNCLCVVYVLQRIAVKHHEIGELAFVDGADAVGPAPAPRPSSTTRPTKSPSATTPLNTPSTAAIGVSRRTMQGWTRCSSP